MGTEDGEAGNAGHLVHHEITGAVIESALRIHSHIGPGLVEKVYERILAKDLLRRGFRVERQKPIRFEFDGLRFERCGKVDILIAEMVPVEVKSVAALAPIHRQQLLTYLRLLDCRVGLLLNFGALHLRDGIRRVVN